MFADLRELAQSEFAKGLEKATIAAQKNAERIKFMYQFPAKIEDAKVHRTAVKFGYNEESKRNTVCLCCQMPVNTVDIPLKQDCVPNLNQSEDLSKFKINSGCSLFFSFIKMAISFLMLRFIIVDFYNILSSTLYGKYCSDHNDHCISSIFTTTSAYNKLNMENMVNVVDILNFVFVIAAIVFFVIYRKIQYQIYAKIDAAKQSQDDFTILVENIPIFLKNLQKVENENQTEELSFNYEQTIKNAIEEKINDWLSQLKTRPPSVSNSLDSAFYSLMVKKGVDPTLSKSIKVRSITLCFSMTEMELLDRMRQDMMDEHLKQRADDIYMDDTNNLDYVPNRMSVVNEQILEMSRKYSNDNSVGFNLTHFVGKAFVSFEYQHYRDYMLRQYTNEKHFLQLNGSFLDVSLAAAPEDVFWFNLRISDFARMRSIASSYLILAMVLVFAFVFLMLIQVWQQQSAKTTNADTMSSVLPIILTIITSLINYGLASLIVVLSKSERHKTRSDYFVSLIIKTVITQFLNTAVMYFLMSLDFFLTFFDIKKNNEYLQTNGIVLKIMSLVVVSGAISIIMNLINPGVLINRILVYFRYYYKNSQSYDDFQIRVNKDIRDPQFDFAAKYTYYIMQLLTVSFYGYLVPLTIPFLIIIFILQYWVDKYNLFTRSSNQFDLNFNVSRKTFKIVECSLLVVAISSYIYSGLIKEGEISVINLLSIIFAGIYVLLAILSPASVEKKLFGAFETYEQMSYQECIKAKKFRNFYWSANPATMFVREKDLNTKEYINYEIDQKKGSMKDIFQAQHLADLMNGVEQQFEL